MTDIHDQQTTADTPICDYVQALLRQEIAAEEARKKVISDFEGAGRRIINGGQTGQDSWDVTDWRTGEVLVEGTGGIEEYDAAVQRLDPAGAWLHIDQVQEDDSRQVDHRGIPASLAEALEDWLGMSATSDEDVAAVVGWSVEEVSRHRERS